MGGQTGIDARRFADTLRGLAKIGADPLGGISRLGLSDEERQARHYLAALATRSGLAAREDPAGNLLVHRRRFDPSLPVVMFGSHLDTVRRGGWLDGAYGVVAALEVLTTLFVMDAQCQFEPVAVGFSNEEGALIQTPFWGSRAITGTLDGVLETACDRDGRSASEYLRANGGDPSRLTEAAWPAGRIAAFFEPHIEQGPVLERQGVTIGVVERIVGRTVFECEINGEQRHAGTTPMEGRRDALVAAARLVTSIESIAAMSATCATATVGLFEVQPNTTNTIPGTVRLTTELRDTDPWRIRDAEDRLRSLAATVARDSHTEVQLRVADRSSPTATDPVLRGAIAKAAASLGMSWMPMSSGAGHDAQIMAAIAPVGMIFVPSKAGTSHAPDEDTDLPELIAGTKVLLTTIMDLQEHGLTTK